MAEKISRNRNHQYRYSINVCTSPSRLEILASLHKAPYHPARLLRPHTKARARDPGPEFDIVDLNGAFFRHACIQSGDSVAESVTTTFVLCARQANQHQASPVTDGTYEQGSGPNVIYHICPWGKNIACSIIQGHTCKNVAQRQVQCSAACSVQEVRCSYGCASRESGHLHDAAKRFYWRTEQIVRPKHVKIRMLAHRIFRVCPFLCSLLRAVHKTTTQIVSDMRSDLVLLLCGFGARKRLLPSLPYLVGVISLLILCLIVLLSSR
jgi:hypothetical protein